MGPKIWKEKSGLLHVEAVNRMEYRSVLANNTIQHWKEHYVAYGELLDQLLYIEKVDGGHMPILRRIRALFSSDKATQGELRVQADSGLFSSGFLRKEGHEAFLQGLKSKLYQSFLREVDKVNGFYDHLIDLFRERINKIMIQRDIFECVSRKQGDTREAKEALNHAFITLYKQLKQCENFCNVNHTAFVKLGEAMEVYYKDIELEEVYKYMTDIPFHEHLVLSQLEEELVEAYAVDHCAGRSQRAIDVLLEREHAALYRVPLYMYPIYLIIIAFIIADIVLVSIMDHTLHGNEFSRVLPLYRLMCIPILAVWLWGLNIWVWYRTRINYIYLFQFNGTTTLGYDQVFKLASILSMLFLVSFTAFLVMAGFPIGFYIPLYVFPAIPLFLIGGFFLLPLPVLLWNTRSVLLWSILNTVTAPIGAISFLEFYVGDVLTSLVKSLQDLSYTTCYAVTLDFLSDDVNRCQIPNLYLPPVIAFLPQLWRMMQCLKRFYRTLAFDHLANSCKYAAGFVAIVFSSMHGDLGHFNPHWNRERVCWLLAFILTTLYTWTWDAYMDWGFFRWKDNPNFPLRKDMFYRHKWFYYYAMVSNFFFRFFWTITIAGFPFYVGISPVLMGWIAGFVEIIRRFTWSLIRIENEYASKTDDAIFFRDTEHVPLPFDSEYVDEMEE